MSAEPETRAAHRRACLWVFDHLLQEGVVPYTPLAELEGVDAAIRCANGAFRDLVILAPTDEHSPLRFQIERLVPRDNLFVVCVALGVTPLQCWIFPSREFDRQAAERGGVRELDLDAPAPDGRGRLKQTLSLHRNAWRLLIDGALKAYAR